MSSLFNRVADIWHRSAMRRRYDALAPRERMLVALLGGFAGLLVLYAAAVQLWEFRQSAVGRYLDEQTDLAWMEQNRTNAGIPAPDGANRADTVLSTIVRTTAIEFGFQPRRTQREADGVGVRIEAETFDKVLRWAHAMETRHGIEITNADIDIKAPGTVNARFSLR